MVMFTSEIADELSEKLTIFSRMATTLFFGSKDESQLAMPDIQVVIASLRVERYSTHSLNMPNFSAQITINSKYAWLSFWELAEIVVHELVLIYQEKILGHPFKNQYYNAEFVDICKEIGLHTKLGGGYHLHPADGQFAQLMAWLGEDK